MIIDVEAIPTSPTGTEELWIQHGQYVLNRKHLNQVVQGKELCDLHVNAFQSLLKKSYPHVGGLQCTLYQDSNPLQVSSAGITFKFYIFRKIIGLFFASMKMAKSAFMTPLILLYLKIH